MWINGAKWTTLKTIAFLLDLLPFSMSVFGSYETTGIRGAATMFVRHFKFSRDLIPL
jgi:hypothetical protein